MTNYSQLDALFAKVVIKYYNMSISENIQRIRQEKGIPQAKVAELIGMERTNYFRLEKRGNKLTIEQLEKIAGALGVSVVELLTGEVQKVEDSERVKVLEKEVERLEESLKEVRYLNRNLELLNDIFKTPLKTSKEGLDECKSSLVTFEKSLQDVLKAPEIDKDELRYLIKSLFETLDFQFILISFGIDFFLDDNRWEQVTSIMKKLKNDNAQKTK